MPSASTPGPSLSNDAVGASSTLSHLNLHTEDPNVETPPTTFPEFPNLPVELRLKIWGIAAAFPQVIGLRSNKHGDVPVLEGTTVRCHLLSVSKEARNEALRTKQDLYHGSQSRQSPKLYVNLDVDTIWLMDPDITWRNIKSPGLGGRDITQVGIKRLAIDCRLWSPPEMGYTSETVVLYPRLLYMMDVKEVVVVIESEEIGDNDEPVFIDPRAGQHLIKHRSLFGYRYFSQTQDTDWDGLAAVKKLELGRLADTCIYMTPYNTAHLRPATNITQVCHGFYTEWRKQE